MQPSMQLSATEVRILGALIEKASTTPDVYPLSLNGLTTACNQTSNRDPVMTLEEDAVRWAVNNLRQQSLVRAIQPSDSRVMKFQHLLAEKLELDNAALAVLCVLLLRGPQTTGELKTRTQRLAESSDVSDVEQTLNALIGRGLVAEAPRRAGQKEARYAQLLGGPITPSADAEPRDAHGDAPLHRDGAVRDDRVALLEATVETLRGELTELRVQFDDFKRQFGAD